MNCEVVKRGHGVFCAVIAGLVFCQAAIAEDATPKTAIPVGAVQLRYAQADKTYPPISGLAQGSVSLVRRADGVYDVSPAKGEAVTLKIAEFTSASPRTLTPAALRAVCDAVAAASADPKGLPRGIVPLLDPLVVVDGRQISPQTGTDLRKGKTGVTMLIVEQGPAFAISEFVITADADTLKHIDLASLQSRAIRIGVAPNGQLISPNFSVPTREITLAKPSDGKPAACHASAIGAVCQAVLKKIVVDTNIAGVQVAVNPNDIDPRTGVDKRKKGNTKLRLGVYIAKIGKIRTVAAGKRVNGKDKSDLTDQPSHKWILASSPVAPEGSGPRKTMVLPWAPAMDSTSPVIRRDRLDQYLYRINRQSGRRVDVRVVPGEEPGELDLEYLVQESKPWTAFYQLSNTGTDSTGDWRHQFGITYNGLISPDDVLSVNYTTAQFDDVTNTVWGHYESPLLWSSDRIRTRINWLYSQYNSDQLGQGIPYTGEETSVGGEIIWNFYQKDEFFLDAYMGLQYRHLTTEDQWVGITGAGDLIMLRYGVRAERRTATSMLIAEVGFKTQIGGTTNQKHFAELGRLNAEAHATIMTWFGQYSTYLEPWLDPNFDDKGVAAGPLAHELAFLFRGQTAFGDRLLPQLMDVVGGFYSVRGYPQSMAAGDGSIVGSAEYRFHIPRAIKASPGTMNMFGHDVQVVANKDNPLAWPDWDLIFRTFIDGGITWRNDRKPWERNYQMLSAGLGFEMQLSEYFNIRCDYGIPLLTVKDEVKAGNGTFHFSVAVRY